MFQKPFCSFHRYFFTSIDILSCDNLKSLILDSHPVGTYQAGNLKVQVKPGARRINAGTFEKAYPATKYPGAYQLRPRPLSQLEKLLTADAVADYAMSGKPTVVVS